MSIALTAMANQFIENAKASNIQLEVVHRVAVMLTLQHNGAVITLLAVFVVIAVYRVTRNV